MPTKGERTREHIVAMAAPIFNVQGFAGSSISDILDATGLEKGGLYRHFSSKEELAVAAFDYAARVLEDRFINAQNGCSTAAERLDACIAVVAGSIASPAVRGGCPLLNTATEADDTHPVLRKRAAHAVAAWQQRVARIVADGVAAGELVETADPEALATVITASLEGAIMMTSLLRDAGQMQRVTDHLHALVASLRRRVPARVRR